MQNGIKPITVVINKKKGKTKAKTNYLNLEGYIELKQTCLKYFYGCWIKCCHKFTKDFNSGGFLTKIDEGCLYLRTIHKPELAEFKISQWKFYSKQDSEQYLAMLQIELEKEKNKLEDINLKKEHIKLDKKIKKFVSEKKRFDKVRDKFFKLFQQGKVQIL